MARIGRVLETSLYVDDLARARKFYQRYFDLQVLHADARMCAYAAGDTVLLLFQRREGLTPVEMPHGSIPAHDGDGPLHVAFAIDADALAAWEKELAESGVPIEGRVRWPRGGDSIYFRDPDGHLIELATPGLWANY